MTIYKWDRRYEHVLRPHRFTIIPLEATDNNYEMIRPDRYYVDIYQTKIEFRKYDLRTLASRKMVTYLKDKW